MFTSILSKSPPSHDKSYTWQKILEMALRHKRELILAHIIAIVATLMSVPIPLLMPLLVDEVLLDQPGPLVNAVNWVFPVSWQGAILTICVIAAVSILLRFITLLLNVWQMRQFTIVGKEVVFRIRQNLIARLQQVSMAEYESLGSGQVISHFVTDLNTLDEFISHSLSKLLVAILSLIGVSIVLFWIHWQLALILILINPIVIYMTIIFGRHVKELKRRENNAYGIFQQTLSETLEGIQQIRAANREKYYLGRVTDSANQIKNHAIAYAWKNDAAERLSFNIFIFGFEIFRALSMLTVVFSDLTIGQMFAVFAYLWFTMGPMQDAINIQYRFHSAQAALQRINKLFTLSQEPHYPHQYNPFENQTTTSIRFENIRFSYIAQDWVLNKISLNIKAGEKVAFVGASGGGKTTLVQVLLGLYPPESGQLYFNEIPVTQIGLDVVREHVVTVLQHPALFNDTLRMNLTLGRDISEEKIWQAIEIAQLYDVVHTMTDGLDTILGQRGVRLSGGQRQRVAVARMILANPKIVVLDEATSALDTETEAKLHRALNEFLKNKTTLIIAHRLSAVKQADRVFVFEQGHIIEEGKHDKLIQENGLYAKLYGGQIH
jgi:ATP-binding cassette, subfamily C, bacterial